ncbi:fibronectin type III domain-containing protein [Actinoplanes sp. NPDC051851]|uniref:fibronectin type III domain-containing protein n=1 Tax=Actinoplanes sp. NPDC051851 TaxID=3154753 RepID=UPI00342D4CFF
MRPRKLLAYLLPAAAVVTAGVIVLPALAAETPADLTDDGGTLTSQYAAGSAAEGLDKLTDNDATTKYLTHNTSGWVQYQAKTATVVDRYSITSANDAPDRDPVDWTLQGSADGGTWTTLDQRSGQTFAARAQTRGFLVTGVPAAYAYYRLNVTANGGSPALQMAEWRLWPQGDGVPAAPSGLVAAAVGTDQVDLGWTDESTVDDGGYPETGFAIESAEEGAAWTTVATVPAETVTYTDHTALGASTRSYRVRAVGTGDTASAPTAAVTVTAPETGVDITDMYGVITDEHNRTGSEGAEKIADNATGTKYYTGDTTSWIKHTAKVRSVVTEYTLTSANDAADRDPKSWVLEGSNDDTTWTALDSRTGETFAARLQRRDYTFTNTTGYLSYRLRVTANNGAGQLQLAEWELFGTGTTAAPSPAAPTALTATAVTGDQAILTWAAADRWATGYTLERSTDGQSWSYTRSLAAGTTKAYDLGLTGATAYLYRIRAKNATGASGPSATATTTTGSAELPATWQEHWLEHTQSLTRVSYNDGLAVYLDPDMDTAQAAWLTEFTGKLWAYTRQTYGDFSNPRLAAVFHQGKYGGGHPATVFDDSHDNRNVIDIGYSNWVSTDTQARDMTSHEIAHIVELSGYGVHESPAFALWKDSKWAEIFQYDAYVGTGMTADAERWYAAKTAGTDDFPRAGTAWFKNWFYPIWRDHGHSAPLAKFFQLLAANYPQANGSYARDMNMGEFVHFWSGAAGADLKPLATAAFGWTDEYEAQYQQARTEFPAVTY